jgi:hypothetical protein
MDWKKEVEFEKGQFLGMFAGLGEDLKITAALMAVTLPPIIAFLLFIDFIHGLFA